MLLESKTATIFGASGQIGSQVSRALALAGATVYPSGPHLDSAEHAAVDIRAANGRAKAAVVHARDEQTVHSYLDGVATQAGRIEVVFNAMVRPVASGEATTSQSVGT